MDGRHGSTITITTSRICAFSLLLIAFRHGASAAAASTSCSFQSENCALASERSVLASERSVLASERSIQASERSIQASNSSSSPNFHPGSKSPHAVLRLVFRTLSRLVRRDRPTRILSVDQRGSADSRTIQGAMDMVPENNRMRIIIRIAAGVYREKISVPYTKPFITFQGAGSGVTFIAWNARACDKGEGGQNLGTFGSATVAIEADYFIAKGITFENTAPPPLPGSEGMQAVALRVSGDKSAFIDCRMIGSQDTLFDHLGRHLFLRCYIEGAIDFIFGDGKSLYLDCELHANAVTYGAIAASQRASPSQDTGFAFVRCRVTGSGSLYLGRAWGRYARVVFAFSFFENIIAPEAWYDWGDPSRRGTVFFGEYRCSGPGAAGISGQSWGKRLEFGEARQFLGMGFINGHKWLHMN